MKKIAVFSGTSEGRELSEKLSLKGIEVDVFVATEYGEKVINKNEFLNVHCGRLDENEIADYLKSEKPDIIFDATHPHAKIITENVKKACEKTNSRYIRVKRELFDLFEYKELTENGIDKKWCEKNIVEVANIENAKRLIDNEQERVNRENAEFKINVMLTTGVKELTCFQNVSYKDNIYIRVLPGTESIAITEKLSFKRKNIIAMEGPFSTEMNEALIKNYDISILVTKNSGKRGGFLEKIKACYKCNTKIIVINPDEIYDFGISVEEAVKLVYNNDDSKENNTIKNTNDNYTYKEIVNTDITDDTEKSVKNIKIVGAGICKKEYLTVEAIDSIKEAQVIIGAKRMSDFAKTINRTAKYYNEYEPEKVLNIVNNSDASRFIYLVSGDTGFFSGSAGIFKKGLHKIEKTGNNACGNKKTDSLHNIKISLIPGISSVSYMASKLNIPYSDMVVESMHGREIEINRLDNPDKKGFFLLCTDLNDIYKVINNNYASHYDFFIGRNFGMDDELICEITKGEDLKSLARDKGLYVVAGVKKINSVSDKDLNINKTYVISDVNIKKDEGSKNKLTCGIMFAATGSESGKTTVVSGLMALLKDEGEDVHGFKCGSDYIDPMFHKSVLGIPSRNLDPFFCDEDLLRQVYLANSGEINIIEAAMGLYDGIGVTDKCSAYEVAAKLNVPIILVVDGHGMGYSITALIKGYIANDGRGLIRGIILNRVSDKFYKKISPVIEKELKIKVYGHLTNNSEIKLKSRHLGLMMPEENDFLKRLDIIKNEISNNIRYRNIIDDLRIKETSIKENINSTKDEEIEKFEPDNSNKLTDYNKSNKIKKVRIAVAKDEAFTFIYEDNIDLLKKYGADIIYFSPLNDVALPDCDGLILYGGYPEIYAENLALNNKMLDSIRAFSNSGKPVLAECGGFMYLLEGIENEDKESVKLASVVKGVAKKKSALVRFGYAYVYIKWHNKEFMIKGHEFHRYDVDENSVDTNEIYDKESNIKYASDNSVYNGIVVNNNIIAGFPHLYYLSCPEFIKEFIDTASLYII